MRSFLHIIIKEVVVLIGLEPALDFLVPGATLAVNNEVLRAAALLLAQFTCDGWYLLAGFSTCLLSDEKRLFLETHDFWIA